MTDPFLRPGQKSLKTFHLLLRFLDLYTCPHLLWYCSVGPAMNTLCQKKATNVWKNMPKPQLLSCLHLEVKYAVSYNIHELISHQLFLTIDNQTGNFFFKRKVRPCLYWTNITQIYWYFYSKNLLLIKFTSVSQGSTVLFLM